MSRRAIQPSGVGLVRLTGTSPRTGSCCPEVLRRTCEIPAHVLIRDLRHTLVHRRGALRPEDDREQFGTRDGLIVDLDLDYVQQSTSVLAKVVHAVEQAVVPYVLTSRRDPNLADVDRVRPRTRGPAVQ